jgi:uncharacterized protein (TIGR02284 family)
MDRTERRVLNHLIDTCHDGARGYLLAADHVTDPQLRQTFLEAADQRQRFADELLPHAQRLGGDHDSGGTVAGSLHRSWMMMKDAMTRYDQTGILAEAQRGELAAVVAYDDALHDIVPASAREVIEAQYTAILAMRDRIQSLAASLPVAGE